MIIVDNDEWRMSAVTEWLKKETVDVSHKDLQNPDYLIANKVGVERATMNDLAQKIKARSFEGQLKRVIDKGYQPAALIEGMIPSHTSMSTKAIYGYISSLSEDGITVIHTVSAKHTAHRLVRLHNKIVKGEFKSLNVPVVRSITDHPTICKLMGTKSVDEKTAEKIKDKYKNIYEFTWACYRQKNTGRSNLTQIPGIGKSKAKTIAESWMEDW